MTMINAKLETKMNEQITNEIYSSYLYLAMAAYFSDLNLDGMAQWMKVQAQEELTHAMKFFAHIADRGGRVRLAQIDQPQAEWASPYEAFAAAYKHEQFISGTINELMDLAQQEKDFAAIPMLNWFVEEQIEEESSTEKPMRMLERIGDSGQALMMFDREMAARTFTYPTTTEGGQ